MVVKKRKGGKESGTEFGRHARTVYFFFGERGYSSHRFFSSSYPGNILMDLA